MFGQNSPAAWPFRWMCSFTGLSGPLRACREYTNALGGRLCRAVASDGWERFSLSTVRERSQCPMRSHWPTLHFCLADKLEKLEKQTGYPKALFFVGITVVIFLTVSLLGGAKLLVDLVGFLYPAYMSFKSMDSGVNDDVTQWLTYWVVFSFLNIFESLFSIIVAFIPFYFWIKIVKYSWNWIKSWWKFDNTQHIKNILIVLSGFIPGIRVLWLSQTHKTREL